MSRLARQLRPRTRSAARARRPEGAAIMDWKLEVVVVPVTDIDRAKEFYLAKLGFQLDADTQPTPELRVVHMTPPGSACSVVIGPALISADTPGGAAARLQLVVRDISAARAELTGRDGEVSEIQPL